MPEWLYEEGIGENRAALVEGEDILEARIERDSFYPRAGAIVGAWRDNYVDKRFVKLDGNGGEAYLDRWPHDATPYRRLVVEVVREGLSERGGRYKLPKVRQVPDDTPLRAAPTLLEEIEASPHPVRKLQRHQLDRLEEVGWSELLEQAQRGAVRFEEGNLNIDVTRAMTLIDVDGHVPPPQLAIAGAEEAARAIRRMGIAGSIGVDLPTVDDKAVRKACAEAFDDLLPRPFERTAVNGFGFIHIVRPYRRASLIQLLQGDPLSAVAARLYRQAERAMPPGAVRLVAPVEMFNGQGDVRNSHSDAKLERIRGGRVFWEKLPPYVGGERAYVHVPGTPDPGEQTAYVHRPEPRPLPFDAWWYRRSEYYDDWADNDDWSDDEA